ncbi:CgeB family protein [Magnetococcus sp. PR-3]|uniref:CgeB family protein n=1 Tax=Magnetococcus sp. PR-3 TaxID=3120355 RepID=UPI002FCE6116
MMRTSSKQISRLLLLYGYHYGTTASFVEQSLRKIFQVCAVGVGHERCQEPGWRAGCETATSVQEILQRLPEGFQPDAIFVMESGQKFFPSGLMEAPCPCWYYSIDPHFNGGWQQEYAKLFDRIFVSFKQYIPLFEKVGHPSVQWLPHAYDHHVYRPYPEHERNLDIVFVGDMDPEKRPERVALLQALEQAGLKTHFTQGIWREEVAKLFSCSKLVFNQNHHGVFNPRNFEGSSCGSVVVTNMAESLTDFFTPDEDILIYEDAESLVAQVKAVLADPSRLAWLSCGAARVVEKNSWDKRMEQLLNDIQQPTTPISTCFTAYEQTKADAMVFSDRELPGKALQQLNQMEWQAHRDFEVPIFKAAIYAKYAYKEPLATVLVELLMVESPPLSLLEPMMNLMVNLFCELKHRTGAQLLLHHYPALKSQDKKALMDVI